MFFLKKINFRVVICFQIMEWLNSLTTGGDRRQFVEPVKNIFQADLSSQTNHREIHKIKNLFKKIRIPLSSLKTTINLIV